MAASPPQPCRTKSSKTAFLYRSIFRLGSCACTKPACDSFVKQDESANKEGETRMPVDAAPTRRSSADAAAVSLSATAVANSGDSLEDSAMECSSVWKSERGVAQQNRQGAEIDPASNRHKALHRSNSEIPSPHRERNSEPAKQVESPAEISSPLSSRRLTSGNFDMMRSYENGFETADGNTTIPKTRLAERRRRHSANQSDLETLSCRQVDLLHQVLPPEVATALKEDQQLAPERFEDLTIFQSDIVGFTQIASQLHAKEVYSLLDTLYRKFDELADKYRLYKIETIGDAYICVGGLPRARTDHARSVVAFAVEAVRVASETPVRTPDGIKYLQIRAGIHSGGILACVTSSLNPRYSLLGETLQWAQGLEQAAKPNCIKASVYTHKLLEAQCSATMPAETSEDAEIEGRGSLQCVTLDPSHPMLLALAAEDAEHCGESLSRTHPVISLTNMSPECEDMAMARRRSSTGLTDDMETANKPMCPPPASSQHASALTLTNLDCRAKFNESVDLPDEDPPADSMQPMLSSPFMAPSAYGQSWHSPAEPMTPGSMPVFPSKKSLQSEGCSLDTLPEEQTFKSGPDAVSLSPLSSLIPSGWNDIPNTIWTSMLARDAPSWMTTSMPMISRVPEYDESEFEGETPDGNGYPLESVRTEPSPCSLQQPSSTPPPRPHIRADPDGGPMARAKSGPPGTARNSVERTRRGVSRANSSIGFARGSAVPAVNRDRDLLNKMLPKKVVATLMRGEKVTPEEVSDVSLIFCGIVGYKELELQLPPVKTHNMLLRLFKKLDRIVTKYELYKVETVADEYVVAGNLTLKAHSHAFRACGFVLEALKAARGTLIDEDDPSQGYVQIRAGINIGNVIASVVGTLTPRYCLFGDAMNMAARMKSASDPDKVTLSPAMAKALADSEILLSLTSQGPKFIKGKGIIECYTLDETEKNTLIIRDYIRSDGYSSSSMTSSSPSIPESRVASYD